MLPFDQPPVAGVSMWSPASRGTTGTRIVMLDLLRGVRVVSFNHFLLGPMGIQALGDLGADVIAVEPPAPAQTAS